MDFEQTSDFDLPPLKRKDETVGEPASKRRHEISKLRIKIAGWSLLGASILLAGAFVLGLFKPIRTEINLYTIFVSSIFGIITLILGFIAGSGIDRD